MMSPKLVIAMGARSKIPRERRSEGGTRPKTLRNAAKTAHGNGKEAPNGSLGKSKPLEQESSMLCVGDQQGLACLSTLPRLVSLTSQCANQIGTPDRDLVETPSRLEGAPVPYDVILWNVFRGDESALRSMKANRGYGQGGGLKGDRGRVP